MAQNQTRRLAPGLLDTNRRALAALRALPDYQPANPACTVAALTALEAAMTQARQAETQAEGALAAARDRATAAEWALHNGVLDCKTQVAAQYGKDGEQLPSLGLKRKSEHKPPAGTEARRRRGAVSVAATPRRRGCPRRPTAAGRVGWAARPSPDCFGTAWLHRREHVSFAQARAPRRNGWWTGGPPGPRGRTAPAHLGGPSSTRPISLPQLPTCLGAVWTGWRGPSFMATNSAHGPVEFPPGGGSL